MRKIILIVALITISTVFSSTVAWAYEPELTEAVIVSIIDGDTLELETGETVRLIGINAPEIGEPGAYEAAQFVSELTLNRQVWLEADGENTDPYGRLRRYVWLSPPASFTDEAQIRAYMLNALLLQYGHAEVMIIGEVRYEVLFRVIRGTPLSPQFISPPYPENPFTGFTPEGTATVIDNATDEHGIEFFTFQTPEGSTFFLIIDRNRADNNVYFLNAVTEWDLMALAVGDAPPPTPITPAPPPPSTPAYENGYSDESLIEQVNPNIPSETTNETGRVGVGQIIAENPVLLAAPVLVILGGIGAVYFKVIRPKNQVSKNSSDYDDDDYDPSDDDEHDDHDYDPSDDETQGGESG